MIRRTLRVITLGLLLTLFCLAIGGILGCRKEQTSPTLYRFKCERLSYFPSLWRCKDYETLKCYLASHRGAVIEKPCIVLPGELEAEMGRAKREPLG